MPYALVGHSPRSRRLLRAGEQGTKNPLYRFSAVERGELNMAQAKLPAQPALEMNPKDAPKLSRSIAIIGQGYAGQAGRPLYRLPTSGQPSADLGPVNTPQALPKGSSGSKAAKPWC